MPKKLTTEEFVRRANVVHHGKYDYSLVSYNGYAVPIRIICPIHGEFEQNAGPHLAGLGCRKCGNCEKHTSDSFISEAKRVHGDLYDYSKVVYAGNKKKVSIGCNIHGPFHQTPNMHLRGAGCPLCGFDKTRKFITLTTAEFIRNSKLVHGNLYDYSRTDYIGNKKPVVIVCKIHGPFYQRPSEHLTGCGCPKCFGTPKKTTSEFIKVAQNIYGDLYDYSKTHYITNKIPVTITCKIHGDFKKWPNAHIYKNEGCPKCGTLSVSNSEIEFLDFMRIDEKFRQFPIDTFIVDGIDESTKTVYEFLGDYWHGNPDLYDGRKLNKSLGIHFGQLYKKTFWRFGRISEMGYSIKYIWENDWKSWLKNKSQPLILQEFTRHK